MLMRLIDFDSEIIQFWGMVLVIFISIVIMSVLITKKQYQAREVIAVNGTKTIACDTVWIVGRGILGTKEHIFHKGEWLLTSSKPIMVVSLKSKRKFLPENCRIIEE